MSPPVLVGLRPLGLGDFCTAVPAWAALRRRFPEHTLVLAAGRWQLPLVELCPSIDLVVDAEPLAGLPDGLRACDIAVNLHGRGPESTRVLADLEPRRLVSFAHDEVAASGDGPRWSEEEHEVERWCRLVASVGADADPDGLDLLSPRRRSSVSGATIVHVGASAPARRWPPERFAAVVDHLVGDGHRIVLTGSAGEELIAERVAEAVGGRAVTDLAGRTGVEELAALVSEARLVVSGDTGVAHLATAYRRPSVTLFGPTPPDRWGPPSRPRHRALWHGPPGDPHATEVDPGLLAIEVDEVLDAIDAVLQTLDAPPPAAGIPGFGPRPFDPTARQVATTTGASRQP